MFLNFYKSVFNQFENITPQNNDTEVVSVRKMRLINLSSVLCYQKVLEVVNLVLVFSRKYRWPKHYFSVSPLGNSQKLLTKKQFLVSAIFFAIINISFSSLRLDLFSIIAKEVTQIRNNVVYVVPHPIFLFCCALTAGLCNVFQHIFVN